MKHRTNPHGLGILAKLVACALQCQGMEVPEDWGTVSCGRRLMYRVLWLERMLLKQLVTLDWGLSLDSGTVPLVACPSWRLCCDCVQGCSACRTSTLNYLGVMGHPIDLKQFREGSSLYSFGNLPLCLRWFQTRKSDGGVELGETEDLFDQVTFDPRAERNGGPSHWGSGGRAFLTEGTECAKALRRGMPGVFHQELGGRYSDQKVTLWESGRWRGQGGNGNQSKVPVRILGFVFCAETHWGEGGRSPPCFIRITLAAVYTAARWEARRSVARLWE